MRILIATGIFPPDIGGPATYSKLLAEELPKRNTKVRVLNFSKVRHLPKGIRHFIYFLKILKLGRRIDIIFAQDPVSVGLPSILAAKVLNKRFILKIVGDYAWEQGKNRWKIKDNIEEFQNKKHRWQIEFLKKIERWVAKKSDKIITPSYYLKKIVGKWGIDRDKIEVIYNAVEEMPKLKISQKEAQEKINIHGKIILSVGRLVPWKGFNVLIKIMPDLLKKIPELKLVIVGDGPEKEKLKLKIKNYNLQNNVFLLGRIKYNQLPIYFKAANLFVLNTGYEGFSHVLLEVMQMKVPVITTNVCGNPEIIKNGYNGRLVDYNNQEQLKKSALEILKDNDLRQKFVENSLKKLEDFSLKKMIKRTLEVLKI